MSINTRMSLVSLVFLACGLVVACGKAPVGAGGGTSAADFPDDMSSPSVSDGNASGVSSGAASASAGATKGIAGIESILGSLMENADGAEREIAALRKALTAAKMYEQAVSFLRTIVDAETGARFERELSNARRAAAEAGALLESTKAAEAAQVLRRLSKQTMVYRIKQSTAAADAAPGTAPTVRYRYTNALSELGKRGSGRRLDGVATTCFSEAFADCTRPLSRCRTKAGIEYVAGGLSCGSAATVGLLCYVCEARGTGSYSIAAYRDKANGNVLITMLVEATSKIGAGLKSLGTIGYAP